MSEQSEADGSIRERLTNRGEDALGKLAQDLLENPLINGAIARAFDAREKGAQAQEVVMGALNIPSASDIERLTRRLRSVSQRLEGIEDGVERIERAGGSPATSAGIEQRLAAIEEQLTALARQVSELNQQLPGAPAPIPRAQERLAVDEPVAVATRRGRRGTRRAATS
jgi:CRP-like cAMP-binding protein